MTGHITRYDKMPIPPVEEHTELFDAGVVSFGVEYRLLDDAIAAASAVAAAAGADGAPARLDDRRVVADEQRHLVARRYAERAAVELARTLDVLAVDAFDHLADRNLDAYRNILTPAKSRFEPGKRQT